MIADLALRFVIGGLVVSAFAALGEMIRPQSLAGIFGAAPSVALATLGIAAIQHGGGYVALEGRSMLLGAVALGVYNALVGWLLMRRRAPALVAAGAAWLLWLAAAFGLWGLAIGSQPSAVSHRSAAVGWQMPRYRS